MLTALLAFFALVPLVGWVVSTPGHRGPASPHFDGRKFRNTLPTVRTAKEAWAEGWPRRAWNPPAHVPVPPPLPRVPGPDWRVTWVGHATVLVQGDGLNILTDPVWSPAAGPLGQLGPRRGTPPGVALADLPRIDVILLSHNHYDHMDIPTLRALHRRDRPTLVTPLGNGAYLEKRGIPGAVELDWEGVWTHPSGTKVRVTEARHFSSRGLFDRDRNLWGAFAVELPSGSFYFAGDTGYGPHFAETAARHGPFRLALLPIGAFLPRWMMRPVHIDPAEAVQAHVDLRAERSLAIHWGAFPLGADGYDVPVALLAEARTAAGLPASAFFALRPGQAEILADAAALAAQ